MVTFVIRHFPFLLLCILVGCQAEEAKKMPLPTVPVVVGKTLNEANHILGVDKRAYLVLSLYDVRNGRVELPGVVSIWDDQVVGLIPANAPRPANTPTLYLRVKKGVVIAQSADLQQMMAAAALSAK